MASIFMRKHEAARKGDDQRLSAAVYETLVESILSGQLSPGTVLSELSLRESWM